MRSLMAAAVSIAAITAAFGALAQGADQQINVTATVPGYCTIGGLHGPARINTTIPVSSTGVVDTSLQTITVSSVVCNTATSITATSMRGGLKSTTKVGTSGFTNIINYKGTATFGAAKSTINTGTLKGASGPESGNSASTSGAATGSLVITILPDQASSPLAQGSDYWDTLRIDLVPD